MNDALVSNVGRPSESWESNTHKGGISLEWHTPLLVLVLKELISDIFG